MSKLSTKLLSLVLAVVMLVSMVPVMAFAEDASPVLTSLTPDASMVIRNASVSGNTYTYKVGYWNDNFKFSIAYEEGVTAVVKTKIGAEIEPVAGVYSLPLRQYSVYTYYIELSDGVVTNTYTLKLQRLYNNETEINAITGTGFAKEQDENYFCLTGEEEGAPVSFGLDLSVGAAVILRNDLGQLITPKNGIYTVSKNDFITATVTAHDGVTVEEWYIDVVVSQGNDDVTLSGIDDATWNGTEYVANTTYNTFLVNATVPAGATYDIYSDEVCYRLISNRNLTLTAAQTIVYIVVTASDGITESDPVKLVINTTADPADDTAEAPMKMGGIDELYLRGGFAGVFGGEEAVFVLLPNDTKEYKVEALPLGYDLTIYSDANATRIVPNNTVIKLNSYGTVLYGHLTNSREEELIVPIVIYSLSQVEFTDEQVSWAQEAIDFIAYSGLGLMKGDTAGKFNGKANLTRNEMAVILSNMNGLCVDLYKNLDNPFDDNIAAWAQPYAKAAYMNGLMAGYKINVTGPELNESLLMFYGDQKITRNEVYLVILKSMLGDVNSFYAENQEMIDNKVRSMNFKDADQVADWAKPAIYTAIYYELLSGDANGYINPTKPITRNEMAIILAKCYASLED